VIYRAYFPSIYSGEDNFEKLLEGFRTKIRGIIFQDTDFSKIYAIANASNLPYIVK